MALKIANQALCFNASLKTAIASSNLTFFWLGNRSSPQCQSGRKQRKLSPAEVNP